MKIIIDIDERAYAGCVKLKNNDDMGILGFHLINATASGTPLSEELEKIKTEIQEQIDFFKKIESFANAYGLEIANGIIKCRIAELKGDNK